MKILGLTILKMNSIIFLLIAMPDKEGALQKNNWYATWNSKTEIWYDPIFLFTLLVVVSTKTADDHPQLCLPSLFIFSFWPRRDDQQKKNMDTIRKSNNISSHLYKQLISCIMYEIMQKSEKKWLAFCFVYLSWQNIRGYMEKVTCIL